MAIKKIKITCQGADTMPLDKLNEFQGELKHLTEENAARLRKMITDLGFADPISIWKNGGKLHILNGHQRVRVLNMMRDDGYEIPDLPVNVVEAKTLKDAKRLVLALTSQYGGMTENGLHEFMTETGIDLSDLNDDFSFPELDIERFGREYFGDAQNSDEPNEKMLDENLETEHECPKCGYKY